MKAERKIYKAIWEKGIEIGLAMNESDAHDIALVVKPFYKAYAKDLIEKEKQKYKREQYGLEIVHQGAIRVLEELLKTIER